jgi:hypothetical protein
MAKDKNALVIKRGTTYPITFTNKTSAGAAIDLTGATVYFTAKKAEFDADLTDSQATIKKDVTTHVDQAGVASATRGITTILLLPADTAQKAPGKYNYDITIKYAPIGAAAAVINTPLDGTLEIDGKPTNRSS